MIHAGNKLVHAYHPLYISESQYMLIHLSFGFFASDRIFANTLFQVKKLSLTLSTGTNYVALSINCYPFYLQGY